MKQVKLEKREERKVKRYDTDLFIDFAKLLEKEPDLFNELATDYPVEPNQTFIINVKTKNEK